MFVIVGLGNPGDKYAHTRHNVGFDVLTLLADRLGARFDKLKCKARIAETRIGSERVALCLPQTYMNASGESVVQLMNWYKPDIDQLLVVYDDIDLEPGRVRFRPKGSAGTHNGMRSIISLLGEDGFPRVRVGTGHPPQGWDLVDWVLAPYQTPEARKKAYDSYLAACDVIEAFVREGAQAAGDLSRAVCAKFDAKPEKRPRNVPSTALDFSGVGEAIGRFIDERYIAGASCVVTVNGRMAYQTEKGQSDVQTGAPVTRDTLWRLASMTKPITGVAAMILCERGQMALDEPIDRYVSGLGPWRVALRDAQGQVTGYEPANRPITVRDILTHSSGLGQLTPDWDRAIAALPEDQYTLEGIARASAGVALDFQPGTQTGYSAIAAMNLLARAVEEITGMDYAQFLSNEIFTPLGMKQTGYRLTARQWAQTAPVYTPGTLQPLPIGDMGFGGMKRIYDCGSAGLVSSLLDYMRFSLMLRGGGQYKGARILQEDTVRLMASPQLPAGLPGSPDNETWGLSMRVTTRQTESQPLPKGCFGWSGAYGTHFWIDPAHDATCVLMVAGDVGGSESPVSRAVERAVTEALTRGK